MKAISIQNPWAHLILTGQKTVECRTWRTNYRGNLLICSSANPKIDGMVSGHAVCIVRLDKIEPFGPEHVKPACLDCNQPDTYAWHFTDLRLIKPFKVKGKLNFYYVDDDKIKEVQRADDLTDAEKEAYFKEYIRPFAHKATAREKNNHVAKLEKEKRLQDSYEIGYNRRIEEGMARRKKSDKQEQLEEDDVKLIRCKGRILRLKRH